MAPFEAWTSLLGIICYGPLPSESFKTPSGRTSATSRPAVLVVTELCDIPTVMERIETSSRGAVAL
jgi:hypothetical protein